MRDFMQSVVRTFNRLQRRQLLQEAEVWIRVTQKNKMKLRNYWSHPMTQRCIVFMMQPIDYTKGCYHLRALRITEVVVVVARICFGDARMKIHLFLSSSKTFLVQAKLSYRRVPVQGCCALYIHTDIHTFEVMVLAQ